MDTIPEAIRSLAALIGVFVVGAGGAVAIAFAFFKWLGEKWLNSRFEERLEAFKHAQQLEIEHLRFRISAMMDRTEKLYQREFEVLPEIWGLLIDSLGAVRSVTGPLQEYPDLDRMSESALDEFLPQSPLQMWERAELKDSARKLEYYKKSIFWHRLNQCRKTFFDYRSGLAKNGLFLQPAMKEKFREIEDLMWKALIEHEVYEGSHRERESRKALEKGSEQLMTALEEEVRGRLWSDTKQLRPMEDLGRRESKSFAPGLLVIDQRLPG